MLSEASLHLQNQELLRFFVAGSCSEDDKSPGVPTCSQSVSTYGKVSNDVIRKSIPAQFSIQQ